MGERFRLVESLRPSRQAIGCRQLMPRRDIPAGARGARWRRQDEYPRRANVTILRAEINPRPGCFSKRSATSRLACEGQDGWLIASNFATQSRRVKVRSSQVAIDGGDRFRDICEADAKARQGAKFAWIKESRRDADGEKHAPKLIAGIGVIGAGGSGSRARRCATEDQRQSITEQIGQDLSHFLEAAARVSDSAREFADRTHPDPAADPQRRLK